MLWTNLVVATALLLGLTFAAEQSQEKVEQIPPDKISEKTSPSELEHQEDQELGDDKNYPSLHSQQGGPIRHEGIAIPVPLPLPARPGHVILPNIPQGGHHQGLVFNQGGFHHQGIPQPVYPQQSQQQFSQQPQLQIYQTQFQHQGQGHEQFQTQPPQYQEQFSQHQQQQQQQQFAASQHDQQAYPSQQHDQQQYGPPQHPQNDPAQQFGPPLHQQNDQYGPSQHQPVDNSQQFVQQQSDQQLQSQYQPQPSQQQNIPTQAKPGQHSQAQGSVPSLAIQDVGTIGGHGEADGHGSQFPGFPALPGTDPWPLPQPEMPKIVHLDVKCEKNLMKVAIEFDKPFNGVIFSKGHYSYGSCVHLPAGSGRNSIYFDVSISSCGTTGNTQTGQYGYSGVTATGTFFENTIIIQYDPQVQEVWDQARKLRCTWHDQYEKAVTFRPFPVDMLDVVRADFAGDNVGCWMQIQVGKGPWASEVAGIVKIGQTMTMVLAIKDDENKFDMLVRNCIAHDGHRAPIELVDSQGCVVRPKLMSRFTKIKNFGSSASVLSYAHFQAFKFPDSMEVHFQCTIQICRYQCPEQCVQPANHLSARNDVIPIGFSSAGRPREERDLSGRDFSDASVQDMTEIGLNRVIRVVSAGDLAFNLPANDTVPIYHPHELKDDAGVICMSTPGFAASLVVLLAILLISCIVSSFLCLRYKSVQDGVFPGFPYELPTMKKNKH